MYMYVCVFICIYLHKCNIWCLYVRKMSFLIDRFLGAQVTILHHTGCSKDTVPKLANPDTGQSFP